MYHSEVKTYQTLDVYRAEYLTVINGANMGDPICDAEDLVYEDVYGLSPLAETTSLRVVARASSPFAISKESTVGRAGAELHLDGVATFMSADGRTTECILLVETGADGTIADVYVLPLSKMFPQVEYVLIGMDRDVAMSRFTQLYCVSFTSGTLITGARGAQVPVEELKVGDLVLTRDDGPQTLRWIGQQTIRAVGSFAPICIRAGAMNNANDLIVSPEHRLFIYQRRDRIGAGRSEVLIKARHLVDGENVFRMDGGYIDYYQMLFDHHQIIFAEGIAAESMLVDTRTRAALPSELDDKLKALMPQHERSAHSNFEVKGAQLQSPNVIKLLRNTVSG